LRRRGSRPDQRPAGALAVQLHAEYASAGQRRGAGAADARQFLDELALWSDAAKIR